MQRAVQAFALAIRIIDSTGEVERTIPNSPKRIEVVTADDAERFSRLPRDDFFTYRSSRISRSYCHSANGRTLNHSQFLEDKVAGDIVGMDLRDERFCRSPERDNLAFCSSTFAVRAGHRTAHQPLDGYWLSGKKRPPRRFLRSRLPRFRWLRR